MKKFLILSLFIFIQSCSVVKKTTVTTIVTNDTQSETLSVFSYKSSLAWVSEVSKCANSVTNDIGFQNELRKRLWFDYTKDSGEMVWRSLRAHKCVIRTYKPWNVFSKVVATTYTNNNIDLYLNIRRNRSVIEWVGTAHHECSHNYGYSHGDNSRIGKENSVPYWIGSLAQKYAEKICK